MSAAVAEATKPAATDKQTEGRDWSRYTQQAGIIVVIALLCVAFQSRNSVFLSQGNVIEILRAGTLFFIVACPLTLVLVAGALDFSAGAVFALGAVVSGLLMVDGTNWVLASLIGIGVGVVIGTVTGALTVYIRLPSLIASLATFYVASGVATVLSDGQDVFGFPEAFTSIGGGTLLGIPNLVYIAVAFGIVFHVLLEKTVFGYRLRATGGNRSAAAANGIRVGRLDLTLFAMTGGVVAVAGLLNASRLYAASPAAGGTSLTFQVLTAVIIGGTSLFGGVGTIAGSALGALLFAVINNGLATSDANPLYQNIFVGIILAVAVAVDQFRRGRRFKVGRH
jgi:ribose transport system permease protein